MAAKEYEYIVSLKRPDTKLVDFISILLCIITLLTFTYFLIITRNYIVYASSIVIQLVLLIRTLISARNNQYVFFRSIFLIGFITWLVGPANSISIAALYILVAIVETQFKFPREIGVDVDGLTFNTIISKHVMWNEVQNMILKDDIITIDLKNNKLIQRETESSVPVETVNEFNEFCSRHIHQA